MASFHSGRQQTRYTALSDTLKWSDIKRFCSGSRGEFLTYGKGVRLDQVIHTSQKDPIEVMARGMHVLYFDPKDSAFESRVVKIDKQVSFLYVLQEKHEKLNGVYTKPMDPFAVHLYDIEEVFTSASALKICEALGLQDDYLQDATAIVIAYGKNSRDMSFVTHDKVMVLISSPQAGLAEMIKMCASFSKHKLKAQGGSLEGHEEEGAGVQEYARFLDACRMKHPSDAFSDTTQLEFQVTLRPIDEKKKKFLQRGQKKKPITHPIQFPLELKRVSNEVVRLMDRIGELPPVDVLRLHLVMYETTNLKLWWTPFVRVFPGGLFSFLLDPTGLLAHFKIEHDMQYRIIELPKPPRHAKDVHVIAAKSVQALILALRHLMNLEHVFEKLEDGSRSLPEVIELVQETSEIYPEKPEISVSRTSRMSRMSVKHELPGRPSVSIAIAGGDQDAVLDEETTFDSKEPLLEDEEEKTPPYEFDPNDVSVRTYTYDGSTED